MTVEAKKKARDSAAQSAMRTIMTEREGLTALIDALGNGLSGPFSEAVRRISAISGRVIVTGIGKSGHIGSKVAATLASTGTPAFFVHPVEAIHGDLGMIARDDVIVVMSWSGETAELQGVVGYGRRFAIPMIAVTAGETSTLAREADVVLLMPKADEACPHGLAPTTSTLMQLAIGDALAIALLEARGFTVGDFHTFHPGGRLGANLRHVAEIMHTGDTLPLVPVGTRVQDAILKLAEKRFGCVGIIDAAGKLVGIITDGDLARNVARPLSDMVVEEMMTRGPKTVGPSTLASTAIAMLEKHNISALLVTDTAGMPVGLVHFHDLLRVGVA